MDSVPTLLRCLAGLMIVLLAVLAFYTLADRTPPTSIQIVVLICIGGIGVTIALVERAERRLARTGASVGRPR